MSEQEVPFSIAESSFNLFGVDVKCHVLNNGQRIIEAGSMHALLEAMVNPMSNDDLAGEMEEFHRWMRGGKP